MLGIVFGFKSVMLGFVFGFKSVMLGFVFGFKSVMLVFIFGFKSVMLGFGSGCISAPQCNFGSNLPPPPPLSHIMLRSIKTNDDDFNFYSASRKKTLNIGGHLKPSKYVAQEIKSIAKDVGGL